MSPSVCWWARPGLRSHNRRRHRPDPPVGSDVLADFHLTGRGRHREEHSERQLHSRRAIGTLLLSEPDPQRACLLHLRVRPQAAPAIECSLAEMPRALLEVRSSRAGRAIPGSWPRLMAAAGPASARGMGLDLRPWPRGGFCSPRPLTLVNRVGRTDRGFRNGLCRCTCRS